MRIGKRVFQARIKGDLRIEFGDEKLTSFAGLELVRRFLRWLDFTAELRRSEQRLQLGGDLSLVRVVLLVLGMLIAGAKRLKSGFALGSIPTNRYSANTAWQKLNVLAHNLMTSFQLATTATAKPRTLKRTTTHLLRSVATLRFTWIAKAGRLVRPAGTPVLRLADNIATRQVFEDIEHQLENAA